LDCNEVETSETIPSGPTNLTVTFRTDNFLNDFLPYLKQGLDKSVYLSSRVSINYKNRKSLTSIVSDLTQGKNMADAIDYDILNGISQNKGFEKRFHQKRK